MSDESMNAELKILNMKIDALTTEVKAHVTDHNELMKAIRGGMVKFAFMTLGAAAIAAWKWGITWVVARWGEP
jgi:hypothetical protein